VSLSKEVGELLNVRDVEILTIKGLGIMLITMSSSSGSLNHVTNDVGYVERKVVRILPVGATTVLDIAGYPA
jgi:hypothetical protein